MAQKIKYNLRSKIKSEGFFFTWGSNILNNIKDLDSFKDLIKEYDNLPIDKYTREEDGLRYRRFARLLLNPKDMSIKPLDSSSFYQSKYINKKYGGIKRRFAQISKKTLNNKFLKNLVIFNFNNLLVSKTSSESWEVGIHMIRIVTKAGKKGRPAPEGVHKDGHDFISIQLIKKENIKGGISKIFNKDKKMFHYASIFNPLNKEKDGTRDILIMNFNRK